MVGAEGGVLVQVQLHLPSLETPLRGLKYPQHRVGSQTQHLGTPGSGIRLSVFVSQFLNFKSFKSIILNFCFKKMEKNN